ncbi:LysR family transcriptional regulator [Vibrio coralliilyticus]|uniref:LysR family transcriptional regulator n=1 Tax=Vibrio coralliilyticus TaxID=190893 RepID=UPI0015618EC1|nr:LysR family transcriptional regulator [Vibrio coralliilyticus]NRF63258.1 LysR family transcriptional regulator [Vibrio coralliilyticus]
MNITAKQLRVLKAISQAGTTSLAAEQLNLSQSGVSRMLAQLEKELDLDLFERDRGRLKIKPESLNLLSNALHVLEGMEQLQSQASEIKRGRKAKQVFKIAMPYTFAKSLAPKLIKQLVALFPDVSVELFSSHYQSIEESVYSGQADVGFTRISNHSKFRSTALDSGIAMCVFPEGHEFESFHSVNADNLRDQKLVMIGRKSSTRHDVMNWFTRSNLFPEIVVEAHSVDVACSLVAEGIGVSIANSTMLKGMDNHKIRALPILDLPRYQYGVIQRPDDIANERKQPVIDAFSDLLQEMLTELPVLGS